MLNTAVVVLVVLACCVPDLVHGVADEGRDRFRLASARVSVAEMLALQAGLALPPSGGGGGPWPCSPPARGVRRRLSLPVDR